MKKPLIVLAAAVLALTVSLRAEGPAGPDGGPGGSQMEGGGRLKELGLSADQMKQLKALREEEQGKVKAARRAERDLLARLQDQVDDKAGDSAIAATLGALDKGRDTLRSLEEEMKKKRAAILTPTQQAKLLLEMAKRRGPGESAEQGGQAGPGHENAGPREGRQEQRQEP